jgi:hypothetical protein
VFSFVVVLILFCISFSRLLSEITVGPVYLGLIGTVTIFFFGKVFLYKGLLLRVVSSFGSNIAPAFSNPLSLFGVLSIDVHQSSTA